MFPSRQYSGRQDPDAGADPGPESLHQAQPLPQTPGRRHQEHQRGHPAGGGRRLRRGAGGDGVGGSERVRGAGHGGHVLPPPPPCRGRRAPGDQERDCGAERPDCRQQV